MLGQTGILSEDVRALLRQVITSSNETGILGETQAALGSLEPVLAALLALLGLGAVSRAATELARDPRRPCFAAARRSVRAAPCRSVHANTHRREGHVHSTRATDRNTSKEAAQEPAIPAGREVIVQVDGGDHLASLSAVSSWARCTFSSLISMRRSAPEQQATRTLRGRTLPTRSGVHPCADRGRQGDPGAIRHRDEHSGIRSAEVNEFFVTELRFASRWVKNCLPRPPGGRDSHGLHVRGQRLSSVDRSADT